MADNLPGNLKDVEDDYIVGTDCRGYKLKHYTLAERLMQVEYAQIMSERDLVSDTLIYILEGGFRGFHKFSSGELWTEWKDGAEEKWYTMYDDATLPWEIYDEDPVDGHTVEVA